MLSFRIALFHIEKHRGFYRGTRRKVNNSSVLLRAFSAVLCVITLLFASTTYAISGLPPLEWEGEVISDYPNMPEELTSSFRKNTYSNDVVFSPDGKVLALVSLDKSLSLWDIATKQPIHSFEGHKDTVNSIQFSPDSKILVSASDDKTVKLWDIKGKKLLHSFNEHKDKVKYVRFSTDGAMLASASDDKTVKLWDVISRKLISSLDSHGDLVTMVQFSPDSKILASASYDKTVKLWDIESRALVRSFKGHKDLINLIQFSPNGKLLVSASHDLTLKLWDIEEKKLIHSFEEHEGLINSIQFSPNGKTIVSASDDQTLKIWSVQEKKLVYSFDGHKSGVNSVHFSPNGEILASSSNDKTIKLWDIQARQLVYSFDKHKSDIASIKFSIDGKTLASVSGNQALQLWDIQSKQLIFSFEQHKHLVSFVQFSPDGKMLASASADETIKLWDVSAKKLIYSFEGHKDLVKSVQFSPDGKMLISASADSTVKLWNIKEKQLVHTFDGHNDRVNFAQFSPDGKTIVSASHDETVKFWDLDSKLLVHSYSVYGRVVNVVQFSPNGDVLALASSGKDLLIIDVKSKRLLHSFKGHKYWISFVTFSPSGKFLVSASYDQTVKLWDVKNKKLIDSFSNGSGSLSSAQFSPDEKFLVASSYDNTIKLWDISKKKLIHTFEGHRGSVLSLQFSPDGKRLASSSFDGVVKIWNIQDRRLRYDLIGGLKGNWLWQDKRNGWFLRGDDGSFLQSPSKGYFHLPTLSMKTSNNEQLRIKVLKSTIESGKLGEVKINLNNIGRDPIWWIRPEQLLKQQVFISTIFPQVRDKTYRLDPKERTQITIPVGSHICKKPTRFNGTDKKHYPCTTPDKLPIEEILKFDLVTATGKRFPVEVPVTIQAPRLDWQEAVLQEDNRTLTFAVKNNGTQAIPEASFQLAGFSLEPQTKKNLEPNQVTELAFVLPENTEINKDTKVTLKSRMTDLPLFEWEFADKPVTLPRPAWQLYLLLLVLLLLASIAIIYLRRYRHPLVVQLSNAPESLLQLPIEQLPQAYQLLAQTGRLEKVLSDAGISPLQLKEAVEFSSAEKASWVASRLGSELETVDNNLFRVRLNEQFPLNVDRILLYYPPADQSAIDAINYLKTIPETQHIVTFISGRESSFQRDVRKHTLSTSNKLVAASGESATEFALSPDPERVLARIIAEQIPLTQISPYQLGGGTNRESMFFGRMELIAHIMNRDPANYLLVAGRQLGKSSLLKALERRYEGNQQVRCFYRALANKKIEPQLARTLGLSGKSSLDDIVEYLEKQIQETQQHHLFLIDEADSFIRHERDQDYRVLNALRQLSEAGKCSFILAGFWHLYDYSVLDYQSPLKNFGEVLQLGALEHDACQQLITQPMKNMNLSYASDALVDDLIQQTGQRANLISISCNEILKQLGKEQRIIEAGNIHQALHSDSVNRALEGWKNLSGSPKDDQVDRVIVYSMINQQQFTLAELDKVLKDHGFPIKVTALERSLARLELAFILQQHDQYYSWRVPLFCERLRNQGVDVQLQGELESFE